MIRSMSYLIGIVLLLLAAEITSAESNLAIAISDKKLNISNMYLAQLDGNDVRINRIDRNNGFGSQQFFEEGREKLYFLTDEESESLLEIDEDIDKTENEENLVEESELGSQDLRQDNE